MSLRNVFERFCTKSEEIREYNIRGITVCAAPEDKKNAEELFNALASVPSGREALHDMAKHKASLYFENLSESTVACLRPETDSIVLRKSSDVPSMCFNLVHEARHLRQWHGGRKEIETQNLDLASRLMVVRATEADAQTQALQACLEWKAQGNAAPMERFEKRYQPIVNGFNKNRSLSDAFKGWYDDELNGAIYEHNLCTAPGLSNLTDDPEKEPFVSLRPSDIAEFCGGERINGFEEFLNGPKARQIHLMTKTAAEIRDDVSASKGAPRDPSLGNLPLRDLKSNRFARMAADLLILKAQEAFSPERTKDPVKKAVLKALTFTVDAVERLNRAEIRGMTDTKAAADLQNGKKRVQTAAAQKPIKAFFSAYFSLRNR